MNTLLSLLAQTWDAADGKKALTGCLSSVLVLVGFKVGLLDRETATAALSASLMLLGVGAMHKAAKRREGSEAE